MDVITEPAFYDPINNEWVQIVRDAETGEVIGKNARTTPFDEEVSE